jgi:hypothetical protein
MVFSTETISQVNKLLAERGKTQARGERLEAYVRRGLGLTAKNARAFLGALQDGYSMEDAMLLAGIEAKIARVSLLTRIARAIGGALGTAVAKLYSTAQLSNFPSLAKPRR